MDQKNGKLQIIMGNETSRDTACLLDMTNSYDDYLNKLPDLLGEDISSIEEDDFLLKFRHWLSEKRIEVKVYTGSANYFHAKTYLFYNGADQVKGETITGSSNFSVSGLRGNTELNVLGSENFIALKEWFDTLWESEEVTPFSIELLRLIDEYKPKLTSYEYYQTIQESYYQFANIFSEPLQLLDRQEDWLQELYDHQYTGISQISNRLEKFGTAVLSDGVGLGKTRTAAGILKVRIDKKPSTKALLIADRKLHKQWQHEFSLVGVNSSSYDAINRETFAGLNRSELETYATTYNFIIIDEVHLGFKNRNTKSYQKALFLKNHASVDLQALLLTATPWNNSREDVLNIGSMFLNTNNIPNNRLYKQFFIFGNNGKVIKQLAKNDEAFDEFWEDIYLQRTRKTISRDADVFAKRNFPTVDISFEPRKNGIFANNFEWISELKFPYMDPINYSDDSRYTIGAHQMQLLLLKLADSSWVAYYESIQGIIERLKDMQADFSNIRNRSPQKFLRNYFGQKYNLADYSLDRNIANLSLGDGINNEKFEFEISSERKKREYLERIENQIMSIKPAQAKNIVNQINDDIVHDIKILESLSEQLGEAYANRDEKYEAVRETILKELTNGRKVIVISQFQRTINYYFEKLRQEDSLDQQAIGKVVGDKEGCVINDQNLTKEEILTRFSPVAKKTPQYKDSKEEINIILGTDTISTGQNLQDATVLINLDLPYNPMQLEQRIGRIDRPRTNDDVSNIYIYTCPIYEAISSELKMTERLKHKMEGVWSDTQFDSMVLPDYEEYLENAQTDSSKAVEEMLESSERKRVYETSQSEKHSDQFIKANERMQQFLKNRLTNTRKVLIPNTSFTHSGSESVSVIKLNLKDTNGSALTSQTLIVGTDSKRELSVTEAEEYLYNSLNYGLDSTHQLDKEEAVKHASQTSKSINGVIQEAVANYNRKIEQANVTLDKVQNKTGKEAAVAIQESVRNINKREMIISKIKEANVSPKEISKVAKYIELVDDEHPLKETVDIIARDINYFWTHFSEFYEEIMLYSNDLSRASIKKNIDIRKASVEKTDYELLIGNINL